MQEVYEFFLKAKVCYLATSEDGQPRVRPFGTLVQYQGRLYFHTGKDKRVSAQLHQNPRVELCAMANGGWLRVAAEAVEDTSDAANAAVLDAKPNLKARYAVGDRKTEVFYLKNAVATFSAFGKADRVVTF